MKRIFPAFFVIVGILLVARPAHAAVKTVRDKYRVVEVDRFEVGEGVQFPPDYLLSLQQDLVHRLQKSKTFDEVLQPGESPANPSAAVLRLSGIITSFDPGSRSGRYIGMGMGQGRIFARLTYSDRATGQTLVVEQVQGVLRGGFLGGKSSNVVPVFAKTIVTNSKVVLGKLLPAPGEPEARLPTTSVSGKEEREVVVLSSKDFKGSEKRLNEQAARGFRLVGFTLTGKDSAVLNMGKTKPGGQTAEYRIVRARRVGTLEKNLNNGAGEGFRLTPHTFAMFGSTMAVITEKTGSSKNAGCQYRVHMTLRVSSLQHKIKKDQAAGYRLVDTWDIASAGHLAILEKRGN